MTGRITPCAWCNGTAAEQARTYAALFPVARINGVPAAQWQHAAGTVMIHLDLDGSPLALLDGGPRFVPTPAISVFVQRETAGEVDAIWSMLIRGGREMMPLGSYPWSPRYGFLTDRWGVSWQVSQGPVAAVGQAVTPALIFAGDMAGRGREALDMLMQVFPGATLDGLLPHDGSGPDAAGTILHAQLRLQGGTLMLMDSADVHDWGFGEGMSLMVRCADQAEVDRFWAALTAGGGSPGRCGWLTDRFGLSWQVLPEALDRILGASNPDAAARVMAALMQMGKLDIAALEAAARGEDQ